MNKSEKLEKKLPKALPDMFYEFNIEVEGNITKKKYTGNFKCHILNNRERISADKQRAFLNGGLDNSLDASVILLNYMLSYLKYSLSETPDWWKSSDGGYELYDANVVQTLYEKVQEFEKAWNEEIWGSEKD